jgi:hypothetical protein
MKSDNLQKALDPEHPLLVYLDGLESGFNSESTKARNLLQAAPTMLDALKKVDNYFGAMGVLANSNGKRYAERVHAMVETAIKLTGCEIAK